MTTSAPRPPSWDTLEEALRQRRPVRLTYHGRQRTVCPHALGWKNRRPMLLAYQTASHTTSRTPPPEPHQRWRCLYIDEIDHQTLTVDSASPWQTAKSYNPARPFPNIDEIALAITHSDSPQPS